MRVLVTGAGGFVGPRLCARIARDGAACIACKREVDVTDREAVAKAIRDSQPDAIVHLAARTSVAESFEDPEGFRRVNVLGTRHVLEEAAAHAPAARVLLVGSGQVYGTAAPGAAPFPETAPFRPDSPYASSKAEADRLGAEWARRGLDVVRARPFNHTGPGQSDRFVAASFARQIAEIEAGRRPPELWVGNLDSVRDLLDVADVVEAYARLLERGVPADAYNVSRGHGSSVRDLLDGLLALSPRRSGIEVRVDPARVRPTDASAGSSERLRAAAGWEPRVPLGETLGRVLGDWRRRVSET
jgi:GDP-4-dehydro-6-deoxy-D-mannose reductase